MKFMSEKIKKRKIMLVGTGFVGMSFAYSMLSEKGIDSKTYNDVWATNENLCWNICRCS